MMQVFVRTDKTVDDKQVPHPEKHNPAPIQSLEMIIWLAGLYK